MFRVVRLKDLDYGLVRPNLLRVDPPSRVDLDTNNPLKYIKGGDE